MKPLDYLKYAFVGLLSLTWSASSGYSQEIWEYSPYRVRMWISMSPTLGLSDQTKQILRRKIIESSEIQFGPTWDVDAVETPDSLFGSVLYQLNDLTIEQMLAREMVLVIAKSEKAKEAFFAIQPKKVDTPEEAKKKSKLDPAALKAMEDAEARAASLNSVRMLDTAIERIPKFAINPLQLAALERDIAPYLSETKWKSLLDKLEAHNGDPAQWMADLKSGKIFAALVPKNEQAKYKEVARPLPTRFPWQPEAMLRDKDKIYLVSVDREGERIRVSVKELDAFVRRMGHVESIRLMNASEIPDAIAFMSRRVFSAMARIEDNDNKTAVVRIRALGLVNERENHPVNIGVGDVLNPFVRRDDMSGNPTVLQNIPFTYIALTEPVDGARYFGAIFGASRGALSVGKNRRTRRVALKVDPRFENTELKLGIRQVAGSSVPGAEIYLRTPGTEDLAMVGRSDWRGVIGITNHELPTISYDLPSSSTNEAISKARVAAAFSRRNPFGEGVKQPETAPIDLSNDGKLVAVQQDDAGTQPPQNAENPPPQATPEPSPDLEPPKPPKGQVKLNVPLYLYYIKNGETLLARLPIITGYRDLEKADLPDDRRRLQTEAFLKGVQGEILDLVVRRKVLDSLIKKNIEKGDATEAKRLLDELKRVKTYDAVANQIQAIHRRALSTDNGKLPLSVQERIEKMMDATRVVMQKYLQEDLVRGWETKVAEMEKVTETEKSK